MNSRKIFAFAPTIIILLIISFCAIGQDYHVKGSLMNSDVDILVESLDAIPVPAYELNIHPNDEPFYTIKFTETIPSEGGFRISASKTEINPNGVSTLDMVLILRYILAIGQYENMGELLASDSNQDGKVSVIDLVLLRRWILGIDADSRWNFYDKDPRLVNINESNPDLLPNAFHELEYSNLPQENIDFFGIKIGDVNNTAVSN